MAKIVRFYEEGGPEVLRIEDGDPGEPGAGEVLIDIEVIGMNRAEAAMRGGHYVAKAKLPSRLGFEGSGRIRKIGAGVTGWAVGDAVFVLPNITFDLYGMYASQAVVPAHRIFAIPDGFDMAQVAATWIAFSTAWGALVETAKLAPGQHVVLSAASGSVGLAAVQIAADLGAVPIATTRGRGKVDALREAGAAHVIVTDEQDVPSELSRITGGKGVPLVFDPIAGPFAEMLFQCLADEGVLMIYGGLANKPAVFPRHAAIRGNLTMRGYAYRPLIADRARFKVAYDYVVERMGDGRFKMPIDRVFELDDVVEAHRYMEAGQQVGKLIMTV